MVKVFSVVLSLLDKMTLFLFNVSLVNSNLGVITKGGLRTFLCQVAGAPLGKITLNANIADIVRSSSTAAIVIVNFIGSNVVGLGRTVNVVVKTGVKADVAK